MESLVNFFRSLFKKDAAPSDEMSTLDMATKSELINELNRRCKAVVVITLSEPRLKGDEEVFSCAWNGGYTTALGMVARLDSYMKLDSVSENRSIEDDDDDMEMEEAFA